MEILEEKDFEELKNILEKEKKGIVNGKIKSIDYEINLNKPLRVILKDENNYFEFYGGKLAKSNIVVNKEEKRAHYRRKNKFNIGVTLTEIISFNESEINNKSYISKKYILREQFDENMIPKNCEKIINDIAENNNKIKEIKDGEFCIKPIESDIDFVEMVKSEDELMKYLVEGSKTKLGDFPAGFYEDKHDFEFNKKSKNYKDKVVKDYDYYMTVSEKILNEFKEIYNKIEILVNGEKITEKTNEEVLQKENEVEENDENDENFENVIKEVVSYLDSESNKEDVENKDKIEESNIEKNDDEEDNYFEVMDSIINDLENKRREEEKQKIRNNKINKAKELMKLSKKLDDEISLIEKENLEGDK